MTIRKKVIKSFWMTTDEIKEMETENAKKELIKKENEKIKSNPKL